MTERTEKTQVELQAVEVSLDTQVRKLKEKLENMRTDFVTNLGAKPTNTEALAQQCSMEEKIETNQHEFQAQLEEVKVIAERGSRPAVCTSTAQSPTFDGPTSWAMLWRKFETVVEHNGWTRQEKYTYLIIALQGRAADVLHGILISVTYKKTLQALEGGFENQHFATAYHSQPKMRTQTTT
jgi:hypothetical protein